MFFNKTIVYFTLIITTVFTFNDVVKTTSVTITEKSSLILKGTSNVNSFSCLFNIDDIKNPIPIIYSSKDGKLTFKKTALILDNMSFDCGGNGINRDFQKTLNTEDHPQIVLSLKEIETTGQSSILDAIIALKIAGLTHSYKIPLHIKRNKNLHATGQLKIKLTDYNLKVPKKLFGIITVDDSIEIIFHLELQEQ